jgi:hypothetical protein
MAVDATLRQTATLVPARTPASLRSAREILARTATGPFPAPTERAVLTQMEAVVSAVPPMASVQADPPMRVIKLGWAFALFVLAGCSESPNLCLGRLCEPAPDGGPSAEVCDPRDGLCKCGASLDAGVVCPEGTTCEPVSLTCVSKVCGIINCGYLGTCDPATGLCRCGDNGCVPGEICDLDAGGCVPCAIPPCPSGFVCDPSDRLCKCYVGAPVCGPGQIALPDGGCVEDLCLSATCAAPGASCYACQGDTCRCGGPSGMECIAPGDSCVASVCTP